MNKHSITAAALLMTLAGALGSAVSSPAQATEANLKCHLRYSLAGWSILYKRAEGHGTVTCDNGERASVRIRVVGGGLTAGKYRIDDGKGEISHVRSIAEVFGDYAEAGAEAGVVRSAGAQVLSKGTTSLALAGTGSGVNLGISVGKFTISRR
jgi:hypothetical protein